jgi:adenylate cyclase
MCGIGPELGGRYTLEGSVTGSGPRVRVLCRLVESTTGAHIWADRFDGERSDLLNLQDQITAKVIAAIDPNLFDAEIRRARRDPVPSTRAYDLMLRALPLCFSCKREGLIEGERLLRWALEVEPSYAPAMAALATHHWIMVSQGWIDRGDPSVMDMTGLAETALALDPEDSILLHISAEIVALPGGDLNGGLALIDRSLAINPIDTFALGKAARLRAFAGDTEAAFCYLDRCFLLNSFGPNRGAYFGRALAHFVHHDYTEAAEWAGKALRANPNHAATLRYQVASLGLLGRVDEGQEAARRLLALVPGFTVARARRHVEFDMNNAFRTPGVANFLYEGLQRCGVPEGGL